MKRLIILYAFLALAIYIGLHVGKDPGYVFIALGHWTIETPLWLAAVVLVVSFLLLYGGVQFLKKIGRSPAAIKRVFSSRRAKRANHKTHQGLIAFSEGRWKEAENMLSKGLPGNQLPLVNYLISARAAEEQGDLEARDNYLNQALKSMPEAKIAILLTQAQLQIASQQYEQADATLNYIAELSPNHFYLLKMQAELYSRMQQFERLEPLLCQIRKAKLFNEEKLIRLEVNTYQALLSKKISQRALADIDTLYQSVPKSLKYRSEIAGNYAAALLLQEKNELAESTLKTALKKQYDDELALLYASIESSKPSGKLSFLEGYLSKEGSSPALLLALGRLSHQLKLWGKARSYLEKSLRLEENPKVIYELGRLHESMNENEKAEKYFNQSLNAVFKEPTDRDSEVF